MLNPVLLPANDDRLLICNASSVASVLVVWGGVGGLFDAPAQQPMDPLPVVDGPLRDEAHQRLHGWRDNEERG